MQRTSGQITATTAKSSVLCSDHFEESCYESQQKVTAQFEIAMRNHLKLDAVPAIFYKPPHLSKEGGSSTRKRTNEARLGQGYCSVMQ